MRAERQVEYVEHCRAWRTPTADGSDYGVLVECGPSDHPYFWLCCPGTATLYLRERDGSFDLTDCQHGGSCNFLDDVHSAADRLVKLLDELRPGTHSAKCPICEHDLGDHGEGPCVGNQARDVPRCRRCSNARTAAEEAAEREGER